MNSHRHYKKLLNKEVKNEKHKHREQNKIRPWWIVQITEKH